jgi:hypothetical protein
MKSAARLPRAVTENLVIRELDDETLVYDMDRDEAHCLNRTAALVWKMCDGNTTVLAAAGKLKSELGMPVEKDLVHFSIKQLQKFNLVERSFKFPTVDRRDLVLKYAPAALVLLPVIVSITAPTPAQAASCPGSTTCVYNFNCPPGQFCNQTGCCQPNVP